MQAGDLGAFPDHARLDRATMTWGKRDPSELAFRDDFTQRDPQVEMVLAETTCPLVFVRGNHEDHQWLDGLERRSPATDPIFTVDVYQRIFCLKTGMVATFETPDTRLHVLGIGRIGPPSAQSDQRRPIYLQPYERERLQRLGDAQVDVLLTHDGPPLLLADAAERTPGFGHARRGDVGGLPEIVEALDRYRPAYEFFGHYGGPYRSWSGYGKAGQTALHKLADLNWDTAESSHRLRAGCMGLLRWNGRNDHHFAMVEEPWLREYAPYHWRSL